MMMLRKLLRRGLCVPFWRSPRRLVIILLCMFLVAIIRSRRNSNEYIIGDIDLDDFEEATELMARGRFSSISNSLDRIRAKWDFLERLRLPTSGRCGKMIHTFPVGRLGNQMFHMATLYGLGRINDLMPLMNPPPSHWKFLEQFFKIVLNTAAVVPDTHDYDIYDWKIKHTSGKLECGHDWVVRKMFFNHTYFFPFKWGVRKLFVPNTKVWRRCEDRIVEVLKKANKNLRNCTLVGAHMRRGDVVWKALNKPGYRRKPSSADYLNRAIKWFDEKLHDDECIHYLILGDNYPWNQEVSPVRPDVTIMEPHRDPGVDMCTLMSMDHMIATSGTYSFWAGYYVDGHVLKQGNTDDPVREWTALEACVNMTAHQMLSMPECWPPLTKATGPTQRCNVTGVCYELVTKDEFEKDEDEIKGNATLKSGSYNSTVNITLTNYRDITNLKPS